MADWRPPEGYVPVESAVEGITIFAPPPPVTEKEAATPAAAKCPNCGAPTAFDVAAAGLTCRFCGYVDRGSAAVGHDAEVHEFTLDALKAGEQGWGAVRKELHCETCGASVSVDEGAITASCTFCGSNHVDVRTATTAAARPRHVIPFAIQEKDLAGATAKWLDTGWIHPSRLARLVTVGSFRGIYLPFWSFTARVDATWKAEVGHEKTVSYTDSKGNRRTRTVIVWRWENGRVSRTYADMPIPGNTYASLGVLAQIDMYDMAALRPYEHTFLAGWQAMTYDRTLPDAWDLGKARMRERAKDAAYESIRSNHIRNFSLVADPEDETWRLVLLPVWLSVYKFRGRTWTVAVNGQSGAVGGQKPVAWWRVYSVMALAFTPGMSVAVCGGVPLLFVGGVPGLIAIVVGLLLMWHGGGCALRLYRRAVTAETA